MSFEQLLSEIQELSSEQETMSKALPAEDGKDDKIQAAAADGGDMDGAGNGEGDGATDDGAGLGEGEQMGKSLGTVTLADGSQVEGIDGTELVKSLMTRVETSEDQMHKALEGALGLIKSQSAMLKSLTEQVGKLSNAGRGRKTAVTVHDKVGAGATMAKSEPSGMKPEEFLSKALSAQAAGRIRGHEVAMIENYVNRGMTVPEALVNKVVGQ
jgi:hypothetical protein